ncbi:MAG: ABC transporter permease [Phycisphaerae bacterium]|nr:ABC transporter permease [Phycisphaerae bacterium]
MSSRIGWRDVLAPSITVVALLVLWEVAVRAFAIPEYLLPSPRQVAAALWEGRGPLALATLRTAGATVAGFAIAAVMGIALGSVLTLSRWLERGVYPLTLLFQMVPLVAIAPLLAIWLGNGAPAVIASSAVVAVFPVIASTVSGLRSADPLARELFRLYNASRWQRWTRLELPAAVPSVVTGLRVAAGLATIGAIVGEFVAGFGGDVAPLGMVIVTNLREFHTDTVFAAVALAAVVGFTIYALVSLVSSLALARYLPR